MDFSQDGNMANSVNGNANAVDSKAEQTSGLLSIFLMAFTLSLVSFSCTGPIIIIVREFDLTQQIEA